MADPDGQEICFVGDEAFRELSQVFNGPLFDLTTWHRWIRRQTICWTLLWRGTKAMSGLPRRAGPRWRRPSQG